MNRPVQVLIARRGFEVGGEGSWRSCPEKPTEREPWLGDKEIRTSLRMLTQDSLDVRL